MTDPTPEQIEAAERAYRKHGKGTEHVGIVCRECDAYFEDRAGFDSHRMHSALTAAAGVTPQGLVEPHDCSGIAMIAEVESLKPLLDTQRQRGDFWERRHKEAAPVDEAKLAEAMHEVEGVHQIHWEQCLCGFQSSRSRSRTEHITQALAEWLRGGGR